MWATDRLLPPTGSLGATPDRNHVSRELTETGSYFGGSSVAVALTASAANPAFGIGIMAAEIRKPRTDASKTM
jgi:hypothetical protein